MVEFSEVHDIGDEAFRDAMDIYLDTIPANERQEVSVIKERVATSKERLLVGRLNDEVVCIALIYPFQNSEFVLIDYLAVKKTVRQKGIGTSLIRHILEMYWAKGRWLIGEVEDPKQGNDRQNRVRRIAFYRRNGAKELKNVPYQLPPMQGIEPTPMILLSFTQNKENQIKGEVVQKLIRQIYTELYKRNSTDTLLNAIIKAVPEVIRLK